MEPVSTGMESTEVVSAAILGDGYRSQLDDQGAASNATAMAIADVLQQFLVDIQVRFDAHAASQRTDARNTAQHLEALLGRLVVSQQRVASSMENLKHELHRSGGGCRSAGVHGGGASAGNTSTSKLQDHKPRFNTCVFALPDPPQSIDEEPLRINASVVCKPVSACHAGPVAQDVSKSQDVHAYCSFSDDGIDDVDETQITYARSTSTVASTALRSKPGMRSDSEVSRRRSFDKKSVSWGRESLVERAVPRNSILRSQNPASPLRSKQNSLGVGEVVRIKKDGETAVVLDNSSPSGLVKVRMRSKGEDGNTSEIVTSLSKDELERSSERSPTYSSGRSLSLGASVGSERSTGHCNFALSVAWPATLRIRSCFAETHSSEEIRSRIWNEWSNAQRTSRAFKFYLTSETDIRTRCSTLPERDAEEMCARLPQRFVLNPSSAIRSIIDLISCTVLLYDLIMTPILLAWDLPVFGVLMVLMCITCIFWTMDIVITLRTGYWRRGNLEMRPSLIVRHYVRTWLVPDAVLVIADWLSIIFNVLHSPGSEASLLRLSRAGKLVRMIGILRISKFHNLLDRLQHIGVLNPNMYLLLQIPEIFAFLLWVNHLMGCMWYTVGRLAPTDTGQHWLDISVDGKVIYRDAGFPYQYTTSLHWALTQMTPGSMQVTPQNTFERAFNNVCLFLGLMFFGALVSTLTAKMTQYRILVQKKTSMVHTMRHFLLQKTWISKDLAIAISRQIEDRVNAQKVLTFKDVPALALLSLSLREELLYELFRPALMRHSLFLLLDKVNGTAMRSLCDKAIEVKSLASGDNLFLAGSEAENAYVVSHGHPVYTQEPKTSKVTRIRRVEVHEGQWISEVALFVHWTHVGTVEATSACELLFINAGTLASTLVKHLLLWQITQAYAKAIHEVVTHAVAPNPWPTDLPVEAEEIFLKLPQDVKTFVGLIAIDILKRNRWHNRLTDKYIVRLENELRAGKNLMMLKGPDQVGRVLALVTLKLARLDGRLLVELAKLRNDDARIECLYPGTKQLDEEAPREALHRLLSQRLWPFEEGINMGLDEPEVEEKETSSDYITSKYTISQYTADLRPEFEPFLHELHVKKKRSTISRTLSLATTAGRKSFPVPAVPGIQPGIQRSVPTHTVYPIETGDKMYLYAWLTEDEIETFKTPGGKKLLHAWIRSLALDHDEEGNALRLSSMIDSHELSGMSLASPASRSFDL